MKRVTVVIVALVLMLIPASAARADITVWVGQISSDDFLIDGTTSYGGAVGFQFLKYFGLEFVVDWVPDSELPFNLEELEDLFGIDVTVDMLFLSGNAVVQVPMDGFTPYATAGFGVFGIELSSNQFEDVQDSLSGSTFFNIGAGAKIDLGPFFALRGEWRMYRLNFSDEEDVGSILLAVDDPVFTRFAIGGAITF